MPSNGVLARVLDARGRAEAWLGSGKLAEAAGKVTELARECGADQLFAASPAAFCVLGVVIHAETDLRLYQQGETGTVLLVDIAVASEAGLQTLADRLRATGATVVTTMVIDDPRVGLGEPRRLTLIA